MEKGLVQVYTGTGKGKTTAALGLALRASGHGMKVLIVQFMKGGRETGEQKAARRLSPNLDIVTAGREGFISKTAPDPVDVKLAHEGFAAAEEAVRKNEYDIVILDEIHVAVDHGLLPLSFLLRLIDSKPEGVELVLTGRNANPEVLEKADLVTEMVDRKHYFKEGTPARRGIEF